jgi:hypothetical protein
VAGSASVVESGDDLIRIAVALAGRCLSRLGKVPLLRPGDQVGAKVCRSVDLYFAVKLQPLRFATVPDLPMEDPIFLRVAGKRLTKGCAVLPSGFLYTLASNVTDQLPSNFVAAFRFGCTERRTLAANPIAARDVDFISNLA